MTVNPKLAKWFQPGEEPKSEIVLSNTTPPHNKFYRIVVTHLRGAWYVKTNWGRIGTEGSSGCEGEYPYEAMAQTAAARLARNKVEKSGYTERRRGRVDPLFFPAVVTQEVLEGPKLVPEVETDYGDETIPTGPSQAKSPDEAAFNEVLRKRKEESEW